MKLKLLIITGDTGYAEHLSSVISEHHADAIDVSVCGDTERLKDMLPARKFDVALVEAALIGNADLQSIHLPLILWTDDEDDKDISDEFKKISKYQRISSIVAKVLEYYARVSKSKRGIDSEHAGITVVWSPVGGVGKTTVALAYAAKKAAEGKQVMYLNLEPFSSVPVYFEETGKSISSVFGMLESNEGDVKMLIRGIRCNEGGIMFLCSPDNYDDMYILSVDNITELVTSCAGVTDELVIDMSCVCDRRTRQVFELADTIYLVTEPTATAQRKLFQFASQHNVFEQIRDKTVLIANKGAVISVPLTDAVIPLPPVQSIDASVVYKTLAGNSFELQRTGT